MTVRRLSIPVQIREWLLDQIARGELAPGDRVIEADVAAQMKVSSIPVREAIRELVAMGILQAEPHRGAWVRQVSLLETVHAFRIRSVLEPLAAHSATASLQGHCQQLRRVVKAIVRASRRGDFAEFQHHNQIFHRTIVEASGNRVLLRVWDSLAFEVRTRFTMDYLTTIDPVAIACQHEPIVDAIDCGDAELAAALLQSHSGGLVEYLCAQMADEADGVPSPTAAESGCGRRATKSVGATPRPRPRSRATQ
jgi:DNA-binding GntR family transcriptional regulator